MQISDNADSNRLVNHSCFLVGCGRDRRGDNRTPRQPTIFLNNGQIQCAQKKGGRWVASRAALLRELGASS